MSYYLKSAQTDLKPNNNKFRAVIFFISNNCEDSDLGIIVGRHASAELNEFDN